MELWSAKDTPISNRSDRSVLVDPGSILSGVYSERNQAVLAANVNNLWTICISKETSVHGVDLLQFMVET